MATQEVGVSNRAKSSSFSIERLRKSIGMVGVYTLLIVGGFIFTFPFLWMVRTSLLPENQILIQPPIWIPWPPRWANYADMWKQGFFGDWLRNSATVSFFAVLGESISSTVVAYGFARVPFPGRDKLFVAVLATLMIPYHVILVPQFIMFNYIGWVNTLYPMIVPSLFGSAFYIFILRQFMRGLPKELDEAAEIDGASRWDTLWRIVLPLSKPAIATVAVFAFINSWNEFIRPLVYIQIPQKLTLAVGIRWFAGRFETYFHLLMGASVVGILPIVILFFFVQKQFIQGIALTGIKG